MSDKVRYYLEQSASELQELKELGVFTQKELAIVVRRRTEYEHRLIARTASPRDFVSYARYEKAFDRLRELRMKRLRKQGELTSTSKVAWAGSRRLAFIFERATRKFPASLELWHARIEAAKAQNAVHVVNRALKQMIRLHTGDPAVWIYAAKYHAEENAAISEARAIMQRGIAINPKSQELWVEYIRLELLYVAKILARRKLLGLVAAKRDEMAEMAKQPELAKELESQHELDANELKLETEAAEEQLRTLPDVDISVLGDAESNPALKGDVALAVFDAAIPIVPEQQCLDFCERVLAVFDEFSSLDRQYLCSHVISAAIASSYGKHSPRALLWQTTLPIRHSDASNKDFPDQLRLVFRYYEKLRAQKSADLSPVFQQLLRDWLANQIPPEIGNDALKRAVELFIQRM